ncbi:hypothetical protein ACHHYP_04047 [Achlya hypogyna]|uniref:Cilia- and flagella-associated protein 206 n=1 Tax=Achlya hypogyna TaxID=1202772 RepID=A0A1V9Z275_ACHHY|nr:hypothetical protein ACHHYP_04047 [Achlya hypogyna]
MLDRIGKVVGDIIARCKYEGVVVSDTLAAFICRTIVQENTNVFCLDGDIDAAGINELTQRSVDMLLRKDSPSLETIKMQLDFDLCYEEVEKAQAMKDKKIANLHRSIVALQPSGTSDFETLTTLYRQIFTLLMVHADADKANDRNIEREVAAALESVFPRIGLKSFVSMSPDDKKFQLKELANIVGGIRLFNREIGKGGAGITLSLADTIRDNVTSIAKSVDQEVEDANQTCTDYTEVLLHVHHYNAQSASGASALKRWQEELNNKRQFLSYMQSLHEDIDVSSDKIQRLITTFETELSTLKSLVGSRTSLPKGQVYPIFEALAKAWDELDVEHQLLLARSRSIKALMEFKDSYTRTLGPQSEWILKAKRAGMPPQEEWFEHSEPDNQALLTSSSASTGRKDSDAAAHDDGAAPDDVPIRMSVDSTPEFMQLPLEYQGYCPWTIVQRGGLLLPGDPSLGVIQYRNAYHVFVNERALGDFMASPDKYINAVHSFVVHRPELIYLLRLQESFPDTSMASLMKLLNNKTHVHPLLAPHAVLKVDASTSTPVHFVDKNIDVNYDWNEWSLRRRALKVANLRNCKTVSVQTTLSNFRKDVDSQVWLPQNNASQTGHDKGTNPTKTVTYFAGLRGSPAGHATSQFAEEKDDDGKHDDDAKETPAILSYTFEL